MPSSLSLARVGGPGRRTFTDRPKLVYAIARKRVVPEARSC